MYRILKIYFFFVSEEIVFPLGKKDPTLKFKKIGTLQSIETPHAYNCKFCNQIFGTQAAQRRHESWFCSSNPQRTNQTELKLFTCEICAASYVRKCNLKSHQKYDCGKSHSCEQCGRLYTKKNNLKRHLRKDHSQRT